MPDPESTTLRVTIDPVAPDPVIVGSAAKVLVDGGLVAFPTETVYGLGAVATDDIAVERIFWAKQRPRNDPLIVHVHPSWGLDSVVAAAHPVLVDITAQWWPGPLTVIGRRARGISAAVSGGLDTVAVRAPAHPVALALLEAADAPIAAPSANRFGHVSPTSATHVLDDLDGRCEMILDAGDTPLGIESTVVRLVGGSIQVLRYGAFDIADLGLPVIDPPAGTVSQGQSISPGQESRHYSPETAMTAVPAKFGGAMPGKSGIFIGYDDSARPKGWRFMSLGDRSDLAGIGARLYATLRLADSDGAPEIVAELTGCPGLGRAIDDRLTRAASGRVQTD